MRRDKLTPSCKALDRKRDSFALPSLLANSAYLLGLWEKFVGTDHIGNAHSHHAMTICKNRLEATFIEFL